VYRTDFLGQWATLLCITAIRVGPKDDLALAAWGLSKFQSVKPAIGPQPVCGETPPDCLRKFQMAGRIW
jgi:hypothetical protein